MKFTITGSVAAVAANSIYTSLVGASASTTANSAVSIIPFGVTVTARNLRTALGSDPDSGGSAKGYVVTLRRAVGAGSFADTAISTTILSSTPGFQQDYTVGDVTLNAGDRVQFSIAPTASAPANSPILSWTIELECSVGLWFGISLNLVSGVATRFLPMFGPRIGTVTTESQAQFVAPCAGTVSQIDIWLVTAPGAGATRTITPRQNSGNAAGGTAITFADAESGPKSVAQTITVAAGDMLDLMSESVGASSSLLFWTAVFTPTTLGQYAIPCAGASGSLNTSAVRYIPLATGGVTPSATEAPTQQWLPSGITILGGQANLSVSPGGGAKHYTVSLRKDAADAATTFATDLTAAGSAALTSGSFLTTPGFYDTQITPSGSPTGALLTMSYLATMAGVGGRPSSLMLMGVG